MRFGSNIERCGERFALRLDDRRLDKAISADCSAVSGVLLISFSALGMKSWRLVFTE
jgi:hypothetical protein